MLWVETCRRCLTNNNILAEVFHQPRCHVTVQTFVWIRTTRFVGKTWRYSTLRIESAVLGCFNPNCAGRGQSWPRWLWRQITGKFIRYFKNIPMPAETSWIYFFPCHNIKKLCFYVHFADITSKVQPLHHPPPHPFRLILRLFQTTRGREIFLCWA